MVCLDIFTDVGLLQIDRAHKYMSISPVRTEKKADLQRSQTMQRLIAVKESN